MATHNERYVGRQKVDLVDVSYILHAIIGVCNGVFCALMSFNVLRFNLVIKVGLAALQPMTHAAQHAREWRLSIATIASRFLCNNAYVQRQRCSNDQLCSFQSAHKSKREPSPNRSS
jgi:hypothetical protein